MSDGRIIWYGWDGNDYEIFTWQNGLSSQITNNANDDMYPNIFRNWIAWIDYNGTEYSINISNGVFYQRLISQNEWLSDIVLYVGSGQIQVAYQSGLGNASEIFYAAAHLSKISFSFHQFRKRNFD